ncbi:hypothetical protein BGZ95_003703 [Linnemannia exigua]|uniref:TPX2 central domain-containing protein n=1 Tax=Linnemannia exigua TaxID=604196 RepID=A0AAD4DHS8_9FUNG|nr:hypothetical protein BGZ95_003703 [Linnemannia exigua]
MQHTSATKTSTTTAARAESIPSRARTTLAAARNITGTNPAPKFNIGTSTAASSRTNNTQSTRPSTLAGLLSSKKARVSVSTIASTTTISATATASTSTSTSNNVHRFFFGETYDNPFLEQPPRKQSRDALLTSSSVIQHTSREALATSQKQARPTGLMLTRVLPINSPVRIPAAVTSIQSVRDSSSMVATHDLASTERLNRDARIMGDTLRKSLGTTAMDIARKSIMQHSAASPRKAFLKVSEVAARSHGEPSLHDLLAASETDNNDYSMPRRPIQVTTTQSFAHPDTPFTFESTPLPLLNPTTAPQEPNIQHRLEVSDRGTSIHVGQSIVQETTDPVAAHGKSSLESSFHARTSMANRAPPYRVLSVNEREVLRSSRGPGFRARPVDPRMFTSAGDSGLPRVVKQPLTIPVSPAFSKRVRTKAAPAPTTTTTTKSYLRKDTGDGQAGALQAERGHAKQWQSSHKTHPWRF